MFSRRVFGGVPDSFKLVLEYGRDSLLEQHFLPSGQVRLPVALAVVEFEFNSDESEASVLGRFIEAKSKVAFERLEERVVLKLAISQDAAKQLDVRISTACVSPALRCVHVVRTSSTGNVPEAVLTALLKHCDLSGVWKLRGAEGFGNFWCSCCEVRSWRSLANLNLSSCGLTSLPAAVGALTPLRILRLSHNRLAALPPELSALSALEVLAADHNQLTAIPAELRRCSSLRHLELEGNKLATPVLDLRALSALVSLQLYGNPLEYLPELSPASALRSLSLANVRIMADAAFSRWEVEVAALPYISRGHKLSPLFKLTFRRSSCQHPLLAGALGRISEDRANCELMAREETAIQQLVLMALSEQPVVAEQACRTLGALAQLGLVTAKKLLAHDVISTITTLLRSPRRASKMCGLSLLSSIAAASDAISAELLTSELLTLLQACIQADDTDPRVASLTALANLAFCRENKLKVRAASGLIATLVELAMGAVAPAAGEDAALPTSPEPVNTSVRTSGGGGVQAPVAALSAAQQRASQTLSPVQSIGALTAATAVQAAPSAAATATAPQSVVRMPLRSASGQRHSDTGATAFGAVVGSPPGPPSQYTSVHAMRHAQPGVAASVSAGGAAGATAAAGSAAGASGSSGEPLSPPHHRGLHHSASTPAAVSLASASAATSTAAAVASAAARTLSPGRSAGVTSPVAAAGGSVAASTAELPPQIALAPPRPVPAPVAERDQIRLLAIKVLAILGENEVVGRAVGQPPMSGRGVRVLALDGGGMRGLALVQTMRHIERRVGRPLHTLFDLVVGTSTGAIVAVGLGLLQFSLDQCEAIYTGLGHKVFNQAQAAAQAAGGAAAAAGGGGWRDSLFRVVRGTSTNLRVAVYGFKHDASTFEELLKQMCDVRKLGCVGNQLIDAAALGGPKVAAVATQVSVAPVTPFLFTSYELPPEVAPTAAAIRACPSSCKHLIWQDGAATANNPAILALQQARLLWPGTRLETLVSLGCGAAPSVRRERGAHAVLDTGAVLVDAATSPDRADEALSTLLPLVPGLRYFRFQPVHERCAMELDDVDPAHWAALQAAVDEYCTAHAARIDELAELLLSGREGEAGGAAGEAGASGAGGQGGDEEEEEEEEPFEGPVLIGPDGRALPRPPRIRLEVRRGLVLVEAPSTSAGRDSGPAGRSPATADQAVLDALARLPCALRRFDVAATAADAALSAAMVAVHLRRQEELQRRHELEAAPPPDPVVQSRSPLEVSLTMIEAATAALEEDGVQAAAPPGLLPLPPAAASAGHVDGLLLPTPSTGGGAAVASPPKLSPALASPRTSMRSWTNPFGGGKGAVAVGGGGGVVVGEIGPDGAAGAGGAATGSVAAGASETPATTTASGTVADASVEAAAAAMGSLTSPSSLYDYFFGSTGPPAASIAASTAAAVVRRHSGASAGGVPPPMTAFADGPAAALAASQPPTTPSPARTPADTLSLRVRSPSLSAGGAAPPTPSALGPSASRGHGRSHTAAASGATGGRTSPAPAAGGHIRPATLLAALLEDLQERCGVLHLGLTAVVGGGGGGGEVGLVAAWQRDVVAVVEPGPEADSILADLGHDPRACAGATGGGLGGPAASLTALFAASRGSPLESRSRRTFSLLARQEVWHQGVPLATLLLQVTRPSALLRPADLAAMGSQLGGLLVTAAVPLPTPVTAALLRAGARAVMCPRAQAPAASAVHLPQHGAPAATIVRDLSPRTSISLGGAAPPGAASPPHHLHSHHHKRPSMGASGLREPRELPGSACIMFNTYTSAAAAGSSGGSGSGAEAPPPWEAAAAAAGPEEVAALFESLLSELMAGATVLGAIAAAERQRHPILRGQLALHYL
ncbi:hypothetical protein GPECTOR_1g133 [Gonium pectorale]|uniref:Patatin n=1 Tax=Gonium pectorale TaxID=33097 RepID=A0A150H1Y0_GONPE|nr:hypothetical protein GPECTOR_1g133 [Gonium pectorale]|eukprot:KXZ56156.1 hypothetical protein GPECTOR_1g133 [Gonium pectorale]